MQSRDLHIKIKVPGGRSLVVLAAAGLLAVGIHGALAADGDPATSNLLSGGVVVPYDGFLMVDSAPVNGAMDVTFELWDDPTSTTPTDMIWSETHTQANGNQVTFYNGRFSVGLGTGAQVGATSIDTAVLDGDQLYLAIQLATPGGSMVPLSGRQAIEAVPYAAWSASSADFKVEGNLVVDGTTTVGTLGAGATTVSSLSTGEVDLRADGVINADAANADWDLYLSGNDRIAVLGGSATNASLPNRLVLNYNAQYANGVHVMSDLSVANDLTFTGRVNGFSRTAPVSISAVNGANNIVDTGVLGDDGFCALTHHIVGVATVEYCAVEIGAGGTWWVHASAAVGGDVQCVATCLKWN